MGNITQDSGARPKRSMQRVEGDTSGFGSFLNELKTSLTNENIRMLTTALDFKPAERDKVDTSEDPGHVFVNSLKEKGIINQTNISVLIEKIKFCGLHGVADDVNRSFKRHFAEARLQPSKSREYEDKKILFAKELREKYTDLCRKNYPVPFLREQYDIKALFVESGIELLEDRQKGVRNERERWRVLEDYKPIFTDLQIKSKICIVDGEPGYGKSTLALQITHDWCYHRAPMDNFEILVLLRLRQFQNVTSIYTAIKKFLLPKDSPLAEDDIANILDNSSVLILLDGYDEYPDRGNKETDIEYIIRGEMFQKHDVVLMTRTGCLPLQCSSNTKRIRLTGFDQATRNIYIRNIVARGCSEDANRINTFLRNNSVSADLCQNPLFFAMICHMANDNDRFFSLSTVTELFRHIIKCFHSHEVIRDLTGSRKMKQFPQDHRALDKMAFERLSRNTIQTSWSTEEIREKVTDDLYDKYIRIGILVEEEVYDYDAIDYETQTRFYHKLFLEWYAAHHLAEEASDPGVEFEPWPNGEFQSRSCNHNPSETPSRSDDSALVDENKYMLKSLNPNDVHYLYRFACGLNPKAALKIVDHLGKNEGYDKYTLLCITEWGGALKEVVNTVTSLCSRRIFICETDTLQVQKCSVKLVEFASSQKIPIARVELFNCLNSGFLTTGRLHLEKSDLSLPVMPTLRELEIEEEGLEITVEEAEGIFKFSSLCPELKYLKFEDCLLPQYINLTRSLIVLRRRDITVEWRPGSRFFILNLECGQWENGWYRDTLTDEKYHKAVSIVRGWAKIRKQRGNYKS